MSDDTALKGNLYLYTNNSWKLLLNLGQLAALQGPKGMKGEPSDPLTIKYIVSNDSELNLLDGDTSVGSSVTLADNDGFVVNDGGTMKTIPASDVKTYTADEATALAIALG